MPRLRTPQKTWTARGRRLAVVVIEIERKRSPKWPGTLPSWAGMLAAIRLPAAQNSLSMSPSTRRACNRTHALICMICRD